MSYQITFARPTKEHLQALSVRDQRIVIKAIAEQLAFQPTVETNNRKLMRPNELASWELRLGNLRIYYDVEEEPEPMVQILAIGIKERNQVKIANKVIEI